MLKNWITYYIFLLASLAFALLYPGRASSAFFYSLLLLPPVSLVLLALMLKGFTYEQTVDKLTAVKGETVRYRLTAVNRGLLLLPYVELSFYGSGTICGDSFVTARIAISPRGARPLDIAFACRYKGVCELGVRQIKIRDFLGLFTFRQEFSKLGILVVYPRIMPIGSFPVMIGCRGEANSSDPMSRENAETISEIRKYRSGDRLRSIHWKLSAKREELMVKNFEKAAGAAVELILDASFSRRIGEEALMLEDKLVECTVALAYHFASRSMPTTLHYACGTLVRQKMDCMGDFRLAYRMLSEASFAEGGCSLPDIAKLAQSDGVRRKTVVIVSSGLTERICGEAMKLKDSGCMVSLIAVGDGEEPGQEAGEGEGSAGAALMRAGVLFCAVGIKEDIGAALMRRAAG